jgi:hypothetical protein
LSGGAVVLNQQYAHANSPPRRVGSGRHAAAAALENALGQTKSQHLAAHAQQSLIGRLASAWGRIRANRPKILH